MPKPVMLRKLNLNGSRPIRPSRTDTKKRSYSHYRGLECKSRKSRTPGVTGKFGLGVQNEAGQSLIEFCQENTLVITNTLFQKPKNPRNDCTQGHYQMVNTEITLIMFFSAKDGEALYS